MFGQIDEHGLEGGVHMTVSKADDQGGAVIADRVVDGGKEQVAEY